MHAAMNRTEAMHRCMLSFPRKDVEKILFQKENEWNCTWTMRCAANHNSIPVCVWALCASSSCPWVCDRSLWRRRRRHSSLPCRASCIYCFFSIFFHFHRQIAFYLSGKWQNGAMWMPTKNEIRIKDIYSAAAMLKDAELNGMKAHDTYPNLAMTHVLSHLAHWDW